MSAGASVGWRFLPIAAIFCLSCTSGHRWVNQPQYKSDDHGMRLWDTSSAATAPHSDAPATHSSGSINGAPRTPSETELADAAGSRPTLKLQGVQSVDFQGPLDGQLLGVFRNTYYDFPSESEYTGPPAKLMNRSCQLIREVPRSFHDAVCVQGSGTLHTGKTISFAKRDCACAESCPRTDQKICFDELDELKFPWGRGALGTAITPLLTIAVDSAVVPLGTKVYIAEYDGVPRSPGGAPHDGCFVAEDRGLKVQGNHVDIFTGNPRTTRHLNDLVPSNVGVHVYTGTARCNSRDP